MTGPRIAYLCSDPGIPLHGHKGASVHFREFGEALQQVGARPHAFVAKLGDAPPDAKLPATQIAPPKQSGVLRELALLRGSEAMAEAIAAAGPFAAVYERLSLFGVAGLAYAQSHRVPLLVEVNAPLWEEAARFRDLALVHTARAAALDVLLRADAVLCVSRALCEILAQQGVRADRLVVHPNAVNGELFARAEPATRPSALRDKATITFVGSLKPWHGIEFLLDAFSRLRQRAARPVGLWVVGEGPMQERVAEAAQRWPGDVVLQGAVPHAEVPAILKASDLAVAPYPADAPEYFCPLKVVEALAAGCPLVASRVRCVVDVVGEGRDVTLFEPGDADGCATAMLNRLAQPRAARPAAEPLTWVAAARRVLSRLTQEVA